MVCPCPDHFLGRKELVELSFWIKLIQHYVLLGHFINPMAGYVNKENLSCFWVCQELSYKSPTEFLHVLLGDALVVRVFVQNVLFIFAIVVGSKEVIDSHSLFLVFNDTVQIFKVLLYTTAYRLLIDPVVNFLYDYD